MRKSILLFLLVITVNSFNCSFQKCVKRISTLPDKELIKEDQQRINGLVKKRLKAVEALKVAAKEKDEAKIKKLKFAIEAYQVAIRLLVQMKNITMDPLDPTKLEKNKEVMAKIRCMAEDWIHSSSLTVSISDGNTLARWGRQFEEAFGDEGRPDEVELDAIYEGREVYTGPREELTEVPISEEEKKKAMEEERRKEEQVEKTLKELGLDESMSEAPPEIEEEKEKPQKNEKK